MNQIAVIGAGTMGIGIAQVAASAGNNVLLHDAFSDVLSRSMVKLESTFNRLVDKGKFTKAEAIEILSRIKPAYNLSELMHSDLVIEAVVEDIEVKRKIFKALENVVNPNCVLASNTSSLSIASIAASCNMPERVIGIHFLTQHLS
jgi:3-hydroxybutyryl-CoA dehydrogenase